MQAFSTIAVTLFTAAALAGCNKSAVDRTAAPAGGMERSAGFSNSEPTGVDWFRGDVEAAFAKAREEGKPILLYWGAAWCPPCHELKAKVFSRPEFIAKSQLFVPVYLDADDPGGQKWSDTFNVQGYPTVVVLRADRTEVIRIAGARLSQYLRVLDAALDDVRPIESIIAALAQSTAPLSMEDCRRLAYSAALTADAPRRSKLVEELQRAIDRCPSQARIERARLAVMRWTGIVNEEGMAVLKGERAASARLIDAVRDLLALLPNRELVRAVADITALDENSIDLAQRIGAVDAAKAAHLRARWVAALEDEADDPELPTEDRLHAFAHQLARVREHDAQTYVPAELRDEARSRVQAALAQTPVDAPERVGVVSAVLGIIDLLGDTERAKQVVQSEIGTAAAPYYYMTKMARIEERSGNKTGALEWFARAYREARGSATRFEWGTDYVDALLRLTPQDVTAVRDAAIEVLDELDGPKRIYGNTRAHLEHLAEALNAWNAGGKHQQAAQKIREHLQGICTKIPAAEEGAREACRAFSKPQPTE